MNRFPMTIGGLIARLQEYPQEALCLGTFWLAGDFLAIDATLTREEIEAAMDIADDQHDAEIGFNWFTLEMAIERMREQ